MSISIVWLRTPSGANSLQAPYLAPWLLVELEGHRHVRFSPSYMTMMDSNLSRRSGYDYSSIYSPETAGTEAASQALALRQS
jgi:hypothetical protein